MTFITYNNTLKLDNNNSKLTKIDKKDIIFSHPK